VFVFFALSALLVAQAIANVKDINDSWILEGLFPIFVLLTIIYVVVVSFSPDLRLTAFLTSAYLVICNLIPQLKYAFVYGFFDPLAHFQYIRELTNTGYVPSTGYYAAQYETAAGSHILVSELSIVTGLDPLIAYKFFLAFSPFIIPLAIYLVCEKLGLPKGLSKVTIMSTIVAFPVLYKFTGRFAIFPMFALFSYLLPLLFCLKGNTRSLLIAIILVGIRIILSHDVTSFFLVVSMLLLLIFQSLRRLKTSPVLFERSIVFPVLALSIIGLAHLIFMSNFNMVTIVSLARDSIEALFAGKSPGAIEYYSGFYGLSLADRVAVLLARIGRDAISIFFSILAPIAMLRIKLREDSVRKYYSSIAIPAFLALLIFFLTQLIRHSIVDRGLVYFAAFSPFFIGITIYWLVQSRGYRFRNVVLAAVMLSLIFVSLVQFYPCQPLLPKISTGTESYYATDLRTANTIYDRSVIYFIDRYDSRLTIAADPMTIFLIYSLSKPSIIALVTQENPIQEDIKAQLIIAAFDENAHIIPSGREALIYFQGVRNATESNSLIYMNGKSCLLLNNNN
jgi:hypothetical protein